MPSVYYFGFLLSGMRLITFSTIQIELVLVPANFERNVSPWRYSQIERSLGAWYLEQIVYALGYWCFGETG